MFKRIVKYLALLAVFLLAVSGGAYVTLTRLVDSRDIVAVPALRSRGVVAALEMLTDLGLNIKIKGSEFSDDIPKNHIVFQDPAPGTEIKKGRDVRIVLSKGPERVVMPGVIGFSPAQARIALEENGLCLATVSHAGTNSGGEERVMAQMPEPRDMVHRGRCINLLIGSTAPPPSYKMPDLTRMHLDEAVMVMEEYSLPVGEVRTVSTEDKGNNLVTDQRPRAGFRVLAKTPVVLTVNRKWKPGRVSPHGPVTGPNLYVVSGDIGFLNSRVRLHLNQPGMSMELFDDYIKPGRSVWFLIPSNRSAGVFLYKDAELVEAKIYD